MREMGDALARVADGMVEGVLHGGSSSAAAAAAEMQLVVLVGHHASSVSLRGLLHGLMYSLRAVVDSGHGGPSAASACRRLTLAVLRTKHVLLHRKELESASL